jgi:hypothetical protein
MATVTRWRVPGCLPGLPGANLPPALRPSVGNGCGGGRMGLAGNTAPATGLQALAQALSARGHRTAAEELDRVAAGLAVRTTLTIDMHFM